MPKDNLKQLIEDLKLDFVNRYITEENFPTDNSNSEVEIHNFGKSVSSEEAIKLLDEKGFEPASFHETLKWTKKNWNGKDPVAILGSSWRGPDGSRHVPFLGEGAGDRCLSLDWFGLDWDDFWWFAGRRKSLVIPSFGTTNQNLETRVSNLEEQMNKLRQSLVL